MLEAIKDFFSNLFKRIKNSFSSKSEGNKISLRLNLVFAFVALLCGVLIARLAYMQIVETNGYKAEVAQSNNTIVYGNVARGLIYDSAGKVLVGNKAHQVITYTKGLNTSPADMFDVSNRLSNYITMPTKNLTKRQLAEYYLSSPANLKKVTSQIPGAAKYSEDARYNKALNKVMNDNINFTPQMKTSAAIFNKMSNDYSLSTENLKTRGVNNDEIAKVGEHLNEMPGVQIGEDWSRVYPTGGAIKSILGTVSSEKTGLPADRVNELLAEGYSRNDSVGQSYIEEQYEPVLKGAKSQTQVTIGGNNQIVKTTKKYPGHKGNDLQLSINAQFQNDLQKLVENSTKSAGGNSTGAYAVVMNPRTGGIIGLAGADRNPDNNQVKANELGSINRPIVMGSVVKGATVSGALMDHVIAPDNSGLTDEPIRIGGTTKSSWFNKNGGSNMPLDAQGALEVSSNSYMMQLIMKEAGFKYIPNGTLNMNPDIFNTERRYFNQFGLGVKTGIDFPGESSGIQGPGGEENIGKALDLSFGNYDAYTTLQVAQYMSTIANGGYRIAPHVVQNIRSSNDQGKLGRIDTTITTKVLNYIPMTDAQRAVVTQGLYQVVHGSNRYKTGGDLSSLNPSVSAKTGTAQTFYKGQSTVTLSLASYSPSDNPQVVVVVAMPNLPDKATKNNSDLTKGIYTAYWKDVQAKPNANNNNNVK